MAEFVGPAIEVGKCIAEPTKRQFKYLCCFNTNIQNLKDEATKLGEAKVGVEGQVDAARRNVQVILPQVETWLRDVAKIQADMTQIDAEILNVKSRCLAIKSRFSLSRKATKMAAHMKELQDDHAKFGQISHPPPPAARTSIPLGQTYDLQSRKHFEEEIMATLREKKVCMMGICGMGGVGKTTMAKKIMSRARGEGLFHEIVMVVVSQPVDMLRIQREMAELLGLKLEVDSVGARAHLLHARLMNTKSILIILDDLWKPLNLEELGIPELKKECTILLTSRDTDVFSAMNVEKRFQMKTLEAEEAWSLFREKVGSCGDDKILFPIAQQIVGECNGLPIALVTVGVALKDKTNKSFWEDALEEIRSCNPRDIPDFLAKVYNPLKLSYDLLENKRAKSIFLLCCLFPEDCNIHISHLPLYAWGLGMLKGIRSLHAAMIKVQMSVEMLKSRSLLLDGIDDRFTKMHDVVRDVGIFIAAEEGLIDPKLSWPGEKSNYITDCTWISLFGAYKITLPGGSVFPNLRFLLVDGTYSTDFPVSDIFFESARNLNVLSIQNYVLRSLPHTIQLLKNLRTLVLYTCSYLKDLSVVGELVSLEILWCFNCVWVEELPVEIGRLNQLKLLHISCCQNLSTIGAGVISRLTRLEELNLIESFRKWEWGASQGKNAHLCELNSLSSLTTLRIEIEDTSLAAEQIHLPNLVEFNIKIGSGHSGRRNGNREMQLELESDEVIIGDWIHQLLRTSEGLSLQGEGSSKLLPLVPEFQSLKRYLVVENAKMARLSDGSNTHVFPLLEFLGLKNIVDLEEIHNTPISSDSFKNLQDIRLESLPKLQHLWNEVPLFCNLSSIFIADCCSLRSVFPWVMGNDYLSQLKSLTIRCCSMLEQVVMWDEQDPGQRCRRTTFPKLEKLELHDLPRLTSLCKGIDSTEFPALSRMEIVKCPKMKSLVSSTDDDSLHFFCKSDQAAFGRLKTLEIDGCDNIISLWGGQIPIDFFTGLEVLRVKNCGIIKTLISPLIARNLRELTIESCGELVKVFEDDEIESSPFLKLETLKLKKLPKLKAFTALHELPSLREVYIDECPEMEKISSGSSLTSPISSDHSFENLGRLTIRSCSMLEQVVLWNEEEQNGHRRITFPKLKKLELNDLLKLTSFCKGIQSIEFPLLSEMEIVKCQNLKSLVSLMENDKKCSGAINHDTDNLLHLFSEEAAFGRLGKLRIESISGEISRLWCDQIPIDFFTGLVDLSVSNCGNIKILFSVLIARNLVNLRKLRIESCGEMVKVIEDRDDEVDRYPFMKLEVLNLIQLPKLEAFCDWRCSLQLPSLREVVISECPLMERSPISSDFFKNLDFIEISSCSMFEQVVSWNEGENGAQSSCITFPELRRLHLHNLPRLTSFCKGNQSIEFPVLTRMTIEKCPNLKTLVSSTEKDFKRCSGAVNHDSGDLLHLFCKSQAAFGRLDIGLVLDGYDSSERSRLWCDQVPMDFFTRLYDLKVQNCGYIKSLFSPAIAGNLVNLRGLSIESCREMVKVIDDEEVETCPFMKLEVLSLEKLPKLKAFCDWRCSLQLPSLRKVAISECPEMERFSFGSSLTTPNLVDVSKNGEAISDFTKDLNDAFFGSVIEKNKTVTPCVELIL